MFTHVEIRKNAYHDSVTLMLLSSGLSNLDCVQTASTVMGTEHNISLLKAQGFAESFFTDADTNDLIIAARGENESIVAAINDFITAHLNPVQNDDGILDSRYEHRSLPTALKNMPDANLALIAVPGEYAAYQAMQCLRNNLHVMIFSDNVSISDEKRLKEYGREKGLLVMGPDCGTAIIGGQPLAFANRIRRGNIGIIGASGTGIQEISVCIHKLGMGISQAIGIGGRDLSAEIDGISMHMAFDALMQDDNTKVLVLVSKPPAPKVAKEILAKAKKATKPIVVCFLGGNADDVTTAGAFFAHTLEEAALQAAMLQSDTISENFFSAQTNMEHIFSTEIARHSTKKYLRGLYTGGTLCKEALYLLKKYDIYSNIPLQPHLQLSDIRQSQQHTIIDLGEDDFTKGRPHPMIAPDLRVERLLQEVADPQTGVLLFDVMLGYGSHADPAGAIVDGIRLAKTRYPDHQITYISTICGVEEDPQCYSEQYKKLTDAGVLVLPSNCQAVHLAEKFLQALRKV